MTKAKNIDIELMRIPAAFFVIFNHTGNNGFFLFSLYDKSSIQFWVYLVLSVFCKFSVPLFFMISGALMLGREPEPLKTLWTKRVFKMMLILLIWSFFYYCVRVFWVGNMEFDIEKFLIRLYDANWNFSFWYLYAYIPMLMSLPILQRIAKSLDDRAYIYLLALFIIFYAILPIAQYWICEGRHNLNGSFRLSWLCTNIFIYPCIGYWLQRSFRIELWDNKKIALLWLINVASILISCYMTYFKATVTGECREGASQAFHNSFVIINCIAIFITCKYIAAKVHLPKILSNLIVSVGGCTFGIYLMHVFFKDNVAWVRSLWSLFRDKWDINYMISAILVCTVVFFLGYAATFVLKKIPFVRRIV